MIAGQVELPGEQKRGDGDPRAMPIFLTAEESWKPCRASLSAERS